MNINPTQAFSAYSKAAQPAGLGLEARDGASSGFSNLVQDALKSAAEIGREAEKQSLNAAAGTADLSEVVTAVANAEVALNAVVAVRDRVIQAYQEIIRMPI